MERTLRLADILGGSINIETIIVIIVDDSGTIECLILIVIETFFSLRLFFPILVVIFTIKLSIHMLRISLADSTLCDFLLFIRRIAITLLATSGFRRRVFKPLFTVQHPYDLENFFCLEIVHLLQGLNMISDIRKPGYGHRDIAICLDGV